MSLADPPVIVSALFVPVTWVVRVQLALDASKFKLVAVRSVVTVIPFAKAVSAFAASVTACVPVPFSTRFSKRITFAKSESEIATGAENISVLPS